MRGVASLLLALLAAAQAHAADDRTLLNHCKALVAQAPQPRTGAAVPTASDAELRRCQQIIREWTLRDSRMSVDENGRPLR